MRQIEGEGAEPVALANRLTGMGLCSAHCWCAGNLTGPGPRRWRSLCPDFIADKADDLRRRDLLSDEVLHTAPQKQSSLIPKSGCVSSATVRSRSLWASSGPGEHNRRLGTALAEGIRLDPCCGSQLERLPYPWPIFVRRGSARIPQVPVKENHRRGRWQINEKRVEQRIGQAMNL